MALQIRYEKAIPKIKKKKLKQKIETVLKDLGYHDKELSILFTNDQYIAELNKEYLNRDGPTNVLAFPMLSPLEEKIDIPILGDIVISVDTAIREAKECNESLDQTIERLIIHGILHLLGYDHEDSKEAIKMVKEEERLLTILKEVK